MVTSGVLTLPAQVGTAVENKVRQSTDRAKIFFRFGFMLPFSFAKSERLKLSRLRCCHGVDLRVDHRVVLLSRASPALRGVFCRERRNKGRNNCSLERGKKREREGKGI